MAHPSQKSGYVITLRSLADADLDSLFEFQRDPKAVQMAAFTPLDPDNRAQFDGFWFRIRNDPSVLICTVLVDEQVAGSVLSHSGFGDLEVSYWIGQAYWGKGVATAALKAFLEIQAERPVYGRAAKDNIASIRVLEKCGFRHLRDARGFANGRGAEIDEVVMVLDQDR